MKRILNVILAVLVFTFLSSVSKGQSEIEYEPGTDLTVTTGADICADAVTINGTFSGDGTQCNSALPVELSSFSAIVKGDKVELNWQTATEVNNYGFEVERTSPRPSPQGEGGEAGRGWEKIGFVNGSGNSNSTKEYSFIDKTVSNGKYFYHLKQIDNDGGFNYSQEVEVKVEDIPTEFALFQNYPNPFNPSTTIKYSIPKIINNQSSIINLKVYDVLGNEVATLVNEEKAPGNYEVMFDGGKLASGVYISSITIGSKIKTAKMSLIK